MSGAASQLIPEPQRSSDDDYLPVARLRLRAADLPLHAGLKNLRQGIAEGRAELLQAAELELRTAVAAARAVHPATSDTTAFEWRVTINRAIILRRLGRPRDAVNLLEEIRENLTPATVWPDAPRALDTLGSAYAELARQDAVPDHGRAEYRTKAIDAYTFALTLLGPVIVKTSAERRVLRVRILSNLAATYHEDGRPNEALPIIDQALGLLRPHEEDTLDWSLAWARTRRVQAECLRAQMQKSWLHEGENVAIQTGRRAVEILEEARDTLPRGKAAADWNQITVVLALTERDVGGALAKSTADEKKREGVRRLSGAVRLFGEAYPYLASIGKGESVFQEIVITLEGVLSLPFMPELHRDRAPELWAETVAGIGGIFHLIGSFSQAAPLYLQVLPRLMLNIRPALAEYIMQVFRDSGVFTLYSDMALGKDLITDICSVLDTHGIAPESRASAWVEIGTRLGLNLRGQLELAARSTTGRISTSNTDGGSPDQLLSATVSEAVQTTKRARAKPRLKWGKDNRLDENPAAFAWRAYQTEAKAGTLHRGVIGHEDKPLAIKLANWLRSNPVPDGIDIPTKPEWNTRQLAKAKEPPRDVRGWSSEASLAQAARYRAHKAALTPK
ncbi:hypothetical protein [Acidisphaera sp. S103]|uniref:hypothetical protein n=1 Tax=Acidisphaera sp. S103 TaxID=1747223 RepID=UPI00131A63AE|nr:hypothetical protein [Acidisphaera sp. S103]